jgi:hypothetical protein
MLAEDPPPYVVQRWAVTLQAGGDDADADHVAELASRGPQDGIQVSEQLLGFFLGAVRE